METFRNVLPLQTVYDLLPDLTKSDEDPANVPFILNYVAPSAAPGSIPFADGAELVKRVDEEAAVSDGTSWWNLVRMPSGALRIVAEYPPDKVERSTVEWWLAEFTSALSLVVDQPDRHWREHRVEKGLG
jgi:hypothetical protein